MVHDDRELVAQQILVPLLHRRGNHNQFSHICRCLEKLLAEWFTKICYGVAPL